MVFTPQIDFQHDALDVGALVSQPCLDGPVGFENIRVVLELAWVADAGVELLSCVVFVPLAAVGFEQVPPVLGEDDGELVFVDGTNSISPSSRRCSKVSSRGS